MMFEVRAVYIETLGVHSGNRRPRAATASETRSRNTFAMTAPVNHSWSLLMGLLLLHQLEMAFPQGLAADRLEIYSI